MRAMARLPECSWAFLTGSARTGGSRRRSFHGTLPLLYKLRSVQGREAEGHPGARVHPLRAQEPSGLEDVRVVRRVAGAPARRHQHGEHERLQHAVARLPAPRRPMRGALSGLTRPRRCWRTPNAPPDEKGAASKTMQPLLPFAGRVCVQAVGAERDGYRPPVRARRGRGWQNFLFEAGRRPPPSSQVVHHGA